MSQIRFYLDEDSVEKSLITAFRNAGLDVVTVTDVDRQAIALLPPVCFKLKNIQ